MARNIARDYLWPNNSNILVRVAILHVGQGASAVVFAANGTGYKTMLVDINLDRKNGGIDVPSLMADLVGASGLDVFVNTHPHDDHLCGLADLADKVKIREVWHSGHVPSRKYGATYYDELTPTIRKVKAGGGKEVILEGSKSDQALGEAKVHVLAPAEHVTDAVNEADADARYNRIHEQCAVLKFGAGTTWCMIVGDADRDAFEKHITAYHKERLPAVFLAGSHHGSRTFFQYNEEDEPYMSGLNAIAPQYIAISAPRQTESKHGHPHDDAMAIYRQAVGNDNVLHTGHQRYSFICDIYRNGTFAVTDDQGQLAATYGFKGDGNGSGRVPRVEILTAAAASRTRVDDRPMGSGQTP